MTQTDRNPGSDFLFDMEFFCFESQKRQLGFEEVHAVIIVHILSFAQHISLSIRFKKQKFDTFSTSNRQGDNDREAKGMNVHVG
jgi:hypothetical protein